MARQVLTKTTAPGSYATAGAALTMMAEIVADGSQFSPSGNDLIIIQNTDVGAQTWTLTSVADPYNRLGTITTEAIAAGVIRIFGPLKTQGWMQADGKIYLNASHVGVKFGIIALP